MQLHKLVLLPATEHQGTHGNSQLADYALFSGDINWPRANLDDMFSHVLTIYRQQASNLVPGVADI